MILNAIIIYIHNYEIIHKHTQIINTQYLITLYLSLYIYIYEMKLNI